MNIERERAAFEWWASDEGESPRATERVGGCYKLAQIQSYWMAWQARAVLQSPEIQALRKDAERWKSMRQYFVGVEYDDPNTGMALFTCHIPQYAYRANDPNKIADAAMENKS